MLFQFGPDGEQAFFARGVLPTRMHMAGLRRHWGTASTGQLLLDSTFIFFVLLIALKRYHIL